MKENIDSKCIGNRKFIIELRFDHKVTLSDKKGAIIENIKSLNFYNPLHWEIGVAMLPFGMARTRKTHETLSI